VITVILFFYLGLNSDIVTVDLPKVGFEWIPIYILVIALALFGVNVFSTLIIGTVLAGARLHWRIFSFTEFVQKT
jgi:uncharacterized membrane protein YecN with MAPEG domain